MSKTNLFAELHRCGQGRDYEKGIKVANKILQEHEGNLSALHCKVVCLIHLGSFSEAVEVIEAGGKQLTEKVLYEKAYCEYRLNQVDEALKTLNEIKEPNFMVNELRAQCFYRLEMLNDCYTSYLDLIKNSQDEYEDEREANLAAVIASLAIDGNGLPKNTPDIGEQTFELCYNESCVLIGQEKHQEALNKLNKAEELCRKTLEEEGSLEDEIEAELCIIKSQMGYVYQMLKKQDTALKMYNHVLKQRPSDSALLAVTCNNVVTINKDQNLFDSRKKMRTAVNEGMDSKLSSVQRRMICYNNCIFLMVTSQSDLFKKHIDEFKVKFSESLSEAHLLEAAYLCKDKKNGEAVDLLKNFRNTSKRTNSLDSSFTLAQLLLKENRISEACDLLRDLNSVTYKLGVVSALVALNVNMEDKESAIRCLNDAVKWYKKNNPNGTELLLLYRETARHLIDSGKPGDAISMLEELRRSNENNPRIVAQLITAYSQVNPEKAKEMTKHLPALETEIASVDVDLLETSSWSLGAKYVKKATKVDPSPASGGDAKKVAKKKKSNKKKRLPKNYDPTVDADPERWLPRWQRSTTKKKKDKRGVHAVGKGTQGAVANDADVNVTKPSPRPGVTNSSPQQGPRQQRPAQQKKKKRGGRR